MPETHPWRIAIDEQQKKVIIWQDDPEAGRPGHPQKNVNEAITCDEALALLEALRQVEGTLSWVANPSTGEKHAE